MSQSSGSSSYSSSSPNSNNSNNRSPLVPYVPATLTPTEQAIDGIVNAYKQNKANVRRQALEQLKAEKAGAVRDTVALGVFGRFFRELLDVQFESTQHGPPPIPPNVSQGLLVRLTNLNQMVEAFERAPVDRRGGAIILSEQFVSYIAWFKRELIGLHGKLTAGQAVVSEEVLVKTNEALLAMNQLSPNQNGSRRGSRGSGGSNGQSSSVTPTSNNTSNYSQTS